MALRVGKGITLIFHTAALEGGEWSAPCTCHTLAPEKNRYTFTEGWVDPRVGPGGGISLPNRDSIPDRTARS